MSRHVNSKLSNLPLCEPESASNWSNLLSCDSEINSKLSALHVNITGQHLQTNQKVGYVVLDVDGDATLEALEELKTVKNTIKARILF